MLRSVATLLLPTLALLPLLTLPTLAHSASLTIGPGDSLPAAIAALRPGDTLTLPAGVYAPVNIHCGAHAVSGTAAQPITVRAQQERQAHLQSGGATPALTLRGCAHWVIEGVYLSNTDNPQGRDSGDVVLVVQSTSITLRRLLVVHPNRYANGSGIALAYGVDNALVEENEIYDVHRHGIVLFGNAAANVPSGNIIRRNYVHGRGAQDLPQGYFGYTPYSPDTGYSCYPCRGNTFENNIAEGWEAGFDIQAKTNTVGNRYLGNVVLGSRFGFGFGNRNDITNSADSMPVSTVVLNNVVMNATDAGIMSRGGKETRFEQMTILSSQGKGVSGDPNSPDQLGDGHSSLRLVNVLSAHNGSNGVWIAGVPDATVTGVNTWANGAGNTYAPASVTGARQQDPQMGSCKVWIPAGSPMKGAGVGGADIGANILYRYEGGTLTKKPLWHPQTGKFPCGAIVPGVNDVAGASCFDVHARLNVNTNGCLFPVGYGGEELPAPKNFRAVSR